jgi:hypothetical protein
VRAAIAHAAQVLLPKHAQGSPELGDRLRLALDPADGRAVLEELRSQQSRYAAARAALRGDVDLTGSLSIEIALPEELLSPAPTQEARPRERQHGDQRKEDADCSTHRCSRLEHRAYTRRGVCT